MPKNKKPAGGRPSQNFDPRYAKKSDGGRKPRWSNDDRAARSGARDDRSFDRNRGGESRPHRRYESDERRSFDRRDDNRGGRSYGNDDRPRRSYDRDDNRGRSYGNDDRPRRSYDRDDRAPRRDDDRRSFDRRDDNRGGRSYNRDDRPRRSFDRDDSRGGRSYNRDDRPRRSFDRDDSRGGRSYNRDDRPRRSFDRDDRAPRRSFDRDENRGPRREFDGERKWQERRDERPQRTAAQEQHIDVVHERLEAQAVQAETTEGQTFGDLGLGDNIVRALAELGAPSPFPIQSATIVPILESKDVLARGRTGSGKTIAFGAPLVESILRSRKGQAREFGRAPQALILAPTRELALQIDRTVQPIARSVGLFTTQIYGGVPQARQVGALKKGVDIIIGTPGRIEDLHKQGKLDLSQVQVAVLDEADHMCELGFLEPVQRILRLTKEGGQKLLFSATLDREVSALVDEFLKDPSVYEVAGEDQETGTIDHQVLVVDQREKREVIERLVDRDGRTIVFTRTRAFADQLVEQMEDDGIRAIALHGDLNQARRTRNIERFSQGKIRVLVATDVAARGIHVDDVDLVVQADAPDEYKTYLHRAGRTGRAGRSGRVVTLIPRQRRRRMADLLNRAEIDAPFRDADPETVDEIAAPVVEVAAEETTAVEA
ncbi:DEAD/DEAH box helicase [Microbacterium indicum]|uniref:DEAD/DEAH box helicase n=1 Tax=Microbacterium indicum TaxID=358100 RepID=UPI00048E7DFC|nr:DEAD/DEAH box helicase [Microbacterium indicum]